MSAQDALREGAFNVIQRAYKPPDARRRSADALRAFFGGVSLDNMPWQLAYALVDRYESAIDAGRRLQRRRSDRPLDRIEHVCVPGLSQGYAYDVIFRIESAETDEVRTFPIRVNSDAPLGKLSLLDEAMDKLEVAIADMTTGSDRYRGRTWDPVDGGRISMALCAM